MAKKLPAGSNQPPIIVKKIIVEEHGGHHGGAWKVAYADFVTAMMAFFLLMWLLGATNEKQRKALADYFAPTLVQMRENSAGADGMFGGDSITAKDNYPHKAAQTGTRSITIPRDATGTQDDKGKNHRSKKDLDAKEFEKKIREQLAKDPKKLALLKNIRFTDTEEGLRIDLIDEANFSMFALATDRLNDKARVLIGEVAKIVATVDNQIVIRGHTDSLPYASGKSMNNWLLSSARAEATRKELVSQSVRPSRMHRIEGVADTEPYNPEDRADDRNRRISITLKRD
ncbi:flagellar motor protein MotB [Sphingomonadales bacterium EhC05]|nr:flagellar motor protein MotB [Sphingomonadales bacterium EhC05]